MIYTAKCYWPGVTERQLEQAAARAVLEAASTSRAGSAIAYLGAILFEDDELVLCLFDAASRAAVRTTTDRAGIPCERVIDSHWLPARDRPLRESCERAARQSAGPYTGLSKEGLMTFIRTKAAIAALSLAGALAFAGTAAADRQDDGGDRHGGRVTTVHCGQTLTQSVRLANDLTNCPADGLVIGADGITVDLNGHTIDGTVAQPTDCENAPREPAGIKNGGGDSRVYDRLTIENGTLQQFAQGFNAGSDTDGMADSRLRDLTVRDNSSGGLDMGSGGLFTNRNRVRHNLITGTRCGNGIVVNSSDGSLVAENTVRDNLGGILLCCSVRNVVRDNLVAHNADDGIAVCCDGRDNLIEHNEVFDNASLGILVFFGTEGTLVRENHVARNGDNIILGASANTVAHNLVTDALGCPFCDPPTGFGIRSSTTADDNVVTGNVVARTKEDGIRILDFDPTDPDYP